MRKPPSHQDLRCPEENASALSRFFFLWVGSLIKKANEKPLAEHDIWDLNVRDKTHTVSPVFDSAWKRNSFSSYIRRDSNHDVKSTKSTRTPSEASVRQRNIAGIPHSEGDANKGTHTINSSRSQPPSLNTKPPQGHGEEGHGGDKRPSLLAAILKSFSQELLLSVGLKLVKFVSLWISSPFLLGLLIDVTADPHSSVWEGVALSATMVTVMMIGSIIDEQSSYLRQRNNMHIESALKNAIFRKAINLHTSARKLYSMGHMTNLVSGDVSTIAAKFSNMIFILFTPIHIVVIFLQLFSLLGPAAGLGFLVVLILVPINMHISDKITDLFAKNAKHKDEKMKLLNEVLTGMKVLKLNAWEPCFGAKLSACREREMDVLTRMTYYRALHIFSWNTAPYLISMVIFTGYFLLDDDPIFTARTAFAVISALNLLRLAINQAPDIMNDIHSINLSIKRIETFLCESDFKSVRGGDTESNDAAIEITSGHFTWDSNTAQTLSNVNLSIPEGSLVAVVGHVGAGKSSLVAAVLGEIQKVKGHLSVKGRVAYVPQQAWIQNDTLQNNILFGKPMNRQLYKTVIQACALQPDIDVLSAGDLTEIGERGINLSGGQKQRVSLARAVYNDADIYLFDDPLSAVDSHVGKHIFDKVISNKGRLSDKTRVLVTHNVAVLSRVDTILVISNKCVQERGSYEELMSRNSVLKQVVSSSPVADIDQKSWDTENKPTDDQRVPAYKQNDSKQKGLGKLIEEESVGLGGMRMNVFSKFLNAFGSIHWLLIGGSYFLYYVTVSLANIWLSVWAEGTVHHNSTIHLTQGQKPSDTWYIGIYFALGILQAALVLGYSVVLKDFTVVASRKLHSNMLETVLKSPMKFFDTTPLGRIANRFSQDINTIDKELPFTFEIWMDSCFQTLCSMCIVFYSAPGVVILLIPLIYCCIVIQRYFISTSRQLKRAYVKSLSDVLSFFSETSQGVELIRAFKEHERFATRFVHLAETHQKFNYYNFISNRWLSMRLSFVCHVILASTALLIFLEGDAVSSGVMGLALSFAYETSNDLRMFIIRSTKLDLMSVSVEKIMEYVSMETEVDCFNGGQSVPPTWPNQGDIRYRNFSLRYRSGLQLALHGINLSVKPGEKVGVVGRTGAGKSSMMLSLFRLIDPVEGAIVIDDINIADVQLSEVRSRLTIIPQDPMLFSETLRVNLDPIEAYDDQEIWTALRHAHLHKLVKSLPGQLLYKCQEGGKNFSIGQRQLLCLARTLLRKSKILVLDEATAAVDMETDDLIQQTIRSEFKDCTVLTIAHRLNTVMDYDRILVLNKGIVEAYDTPERLLQDTKGIFYALARHAGIV